MKNLPILSTLGATYLICFVTSPIVQNEAYHNFADQRQLICCSNTIDVFSNAIFIIVGLLGIYSTLKSQVLKDLKTYTLTFFISTIWVGLGSAYYHLEPNSQTLVWDRLPMTIAFMSLLAFILHILKQEKTAKALFPWLLLAGVSSVVYWVLTGDLKVYLLVQFLPMLWLPCKLIKTKSPYHLYLWALLLFYVLAKVCEKADRKIYELTHELISGHSLKHIFAGIAVSMIILLIIKIKKA